jgi:hypothetical protein
MSLETRKSASLDNHSRVRGGRHEAGCHRAQRGIRSLATVFTANNTCNASFSSACAPIQSLGTLTHIQTHHASSSHSHTPRRRPALLQAQLHQRWH